MKIKLCVLVIMSLILSSIPSFAIVKDTNPGYVHDQNTQFVTRSEVNEWANKLQNWFDFESNKKLYKKVASRSNAHGYYSPNEIVID